MINVVTTLIYFTLKQYPAYIRIWKQYLKIQIHILIWKLQDYSNPDNFKVEKAYSTNKPHNITPISKKIG